MDRVGLYIIWDTKAQMAAMPPQMQRNETVAIRNFRDIIESNESFVAKHPEDYELRHIGDLDFQSGNITGTNEEIIFHDEIAVIKHKVVITAKQVIDSISRDRKPMGVIE